MRTAGPDVVRPTAAGFLAIVLTEPPGLGFSLSLPESAEAVPGRVDARLADIDHTEAHKPQSTGSENRFEIEFNLGCSLQVLTGSSNEIRQLSLVRYIRFF